MGRNQAAKTDSLTSDWRRDKDFFQVVFIVQESPQATGEISTSYPQPVHGENDQKIKFRRYYICGKDPMQGIFFGSNARSIFLDLVKGYAIIRNPKSGNIIIRSFS